MLININNQTVLDTESISDIVYKSARTDKFDDGEGSCCKELEWVDRIVINRFDKPHLTITQYEVGYKKGALDRVFNELISYWKPNQKNIPTILFR